MCCAHLQHWKLYCLVPLHSTQILHLVHSTYQDTVRRIDIGGAVSLKNLELSIYALRLLSTSICNRYIGAS